MTTIRRMDQELRRVIKNIYHLPQCTANGLLYCKKEDGGLGIPKLETISASACLQLGLKFQQNTDPVIRVVYEESKLEERMRKIARSVRMHWPIAKRGEVDKYRAREKKLELKRWARLKSQGKAVAFFTEDKIGNCWLKNTDILKPIKFITALKTRANVAGDKVALAREKIKEDVDCRRCHAQKETLGHILGQCVYTKKARIERHDTIKDYILQRVIEKDKEAIVTREPNLRSPEGNVLKPDLVIKNQEGVFVVDITVSHEDGDYLRLARRGKIEKYNKLLPDLQDRLSTTEGEVLPIVVGSRGAMPRNTILALLKLKITDSKDPRKIALTAPHRSIDIYSCFMDYNAPPETELIPHRRTSGLGFESTPTTEAPRRRASLTNSS
jgi:hypothetical protein